MRVMLTGGTGFLGGHTAAALVAAGHEPHLLVRNSQKLGQLCALHDLDPEVVSFTVGDVRDDDAVLAALDQCQACIHAAAATPGDIADSSTVHSINDAAARMVLDRAVAAGCDPVIFVSSLVVIAPSSGLVISADDPVREGGSSYVASKAAAELHARALQADGQPVVTVYPGGIFGPKDVGVNGGQSLIAHMLESPVHPRAASGGLLAVDVRDLADALTRLLDRGRGSRRYMAGGNFLTWDQLALAIDKATGVDRPVVDITEEDMTETFGRQATRYHLGLKPSDDEPIQRDTGTNWRPFADTLADLMRWMATRPA